MSERTAVPSADFIRNIGYWQNEALRRPISITHHGRERLVLAAPDAFVGGAVNAEALHGEEQATNRAEYAALLEHMEEGFLAFDATLRVHSANTVAESFIGRSREDLLDRGATEIFARPLGSIVADRLQRVFRSRKAEELDSDAFDGRHIHMRIYPSSGGVVALFTNDTEQYAMRRESEENAALKEAVLRSSRAGLIKLEGRGRIEDAGDTFCKWTGFTSADLIGHRLVDLVATASRRNFLHTFEAALKEGDTLVSRITVLAKSGAELVGDAAISPIMTDFVARGACVLFAAEPAAD